MSPSIINDNSNYFSNPTDVANLMNNFFINKVTKIVTELKVANGDRTKLLRKLWYKWNGRNKVNKFKFQSVSEERVK